MVFVPTLVLTVLVLSAVTTQFGKLFHTVSIAMFMQVLLETNLL